MNASTNRLSPDPDELPLQQAGTFWTSLRYLADGRLIIALLLLIYIPVLGPDTPAAHPFQRTLFIGLTAFYMGFAVLSSIAVRRIRRGFSLQLFAQITVDVLVLGLIVYASNGRSGLGALMMLLNKINQRATQKYSLFWSRFSDQKLSRRASVSGDGRLS